MEVANRIVAEVLEGIKERVAPGIETRELDELAEAMCRRHRVEPAFKGYRGYPQLALHLGERRDRPRHPGGPATQGRGLGEPRFRGEVPGLLRGCRADRGRGGGDPQGPGPDGGHRKGAVRRDRPGEGRQAPDGHLPRGADRGGGRRLRGDPGVRGPRHRPRRCTKTRRFPILGRRDGGRCSRRA